MKEQQLTTEEKHRIIMTRYRKRIKLGFQIKQVDGQYEFIPKAGVHPFLARVAEKAITDFMFYKARLQTDF